MKNDLSLDQRDSAAWAPLAAVNDPRFDWGDDRPPGRAWRETVTYEAHVKGLTQLHPEVPESLRGTYAGAAAPPAIEHLPGQGITAIELMPIHHGVQQHNNGYCQDNELSWLSWELNEHQRALLDWTRRVTQFRQRHPNLRRHKFFQGRPLRGTEVKDPMLLGLSSSGASAP